MWYVEDYEAFVRQCEALVERTEEYAGTLITNKKLEKTLLRDLANNQLQIARLMAVQVGVDLMVRKNVI